MGYGVADLAMFALIDASQEREGTSYFEFHPRELPAEHACWLPESMYLKDAAFDFYAECFHRADPEFDYFAFQRFDRGKITVLTQELNTFTESLNSTATRETLFSRYSSLFNTEIWSDVKTEQLVPRVRETGAALNKFIRKQTKTSGCLWVLGM
jgi:hypothetical protein